MAAVGQKGGFSAENVPFQRTFTTAYIYLSWED